MKKCLISDPGLEIYMMSLENLVMLESKLNIKLLVTCQKGLRSLLE